MEERSADRAKRVCSDSAPDGFAASGAESQPTRIALADPGPDQRGFPRRIVAIALVVTKIGAGQAKRVYREGSNWWARRRLLMSRASRICRTGWVGMPQSRLQRMMSRFS